MQTTGSYDMIAADDAMRHSVGEGDCCLAPVDSGIGFKTCNFHQTLSATLRNLSKAMLLMPLGKFCLMMRQPIMTLLFNSRMA